MPSRAVTPIVTDIDVGKSRLEAHVLPLDQGRSFAKDKCGRRALRNWLLRLGVTRAEFEPTARYHRQLHQCLFAAGIDTVPANSLRSRRFAEALGHLAKNDRVDALMLVTYGQLDNLRAVQPKPQKLCHLSDLVALRRELVEQREVGSDAARAVGATALEDLDRRIRACLAADEGLARSAAIVQSVPGLGPACAASLCADMPALGSLDRRPAAACRRPPVGWGPGKPLLKSQFPRIFA